MKAELKLGKPSETRVIIDGVELANAVGALRLTRMDGAMVLSASAGTQPTLTLDLVLNSASVTANGAVLINALPVTDEIGRAIYSALQAKYGTTC